MKIASRSTELPAEISALHGNAKPHNARLLTFTEAAERLHVDVGTIRRWVRTEQCPSVRIGRRIRIPAAWADDPDGWLARWGL